MAKYCPLQFQGSFNGVWWYQAQKCGDCQTYTVSDTRAHVIDFHCQSCMPGIDCSDPIDDGLGRVAAPASDPEWLPLGTLHAFFGATRTKYVDPKSANIAPVNGYHPNWFYAGSAGSYSLDNDKVAEIRIDDTNDLEHVRYVRIIELSVGAPPQFVGIGLELDVNVLGLNYAGTIRMNATAWDRPLSRNRYKIQVADGDHKPYYVYSWNSLILTGTPHMPAVAAQTRRRRRRGR